MTSVKVQSVGSLRAQMKAIARGERPAPTDAARPSFNSVAALVRLLTPDNRQLLALIRDRKPQSVVELVKMTGRAQPNLTRTLAKLEAAGFITMRAVGRHHEALDAAVEKDRDRNRSLFGPRPPSGCVRWLESRRGKLEGTRTIQMSAAPDNAMRKCAFQELTTNSGSVRPSRERGG